ncbi:Serine protease Clip domain PPAF-2 [Popillia japonica]|uniref:Serine protease Clip domain PPAF-2 n=1 Tax=Popillia japonica TaxID=7064 RepID=A0AAW1JJ52_POPJA
MEDKELIEKKLESIFRGISDEKLEIVRYTNSDDCTCVPFYLCHSPSNTGITTWEDSKYGPSSCLAVYVIISSYRIGVFKMFSEVTIKTLLLTTTCVLTVLAQIENDKEDTSKLIQAIFGNTSQEVNPPAKKSDCTCVPYYLCSSAVNNGEAIIDMRGDYENVCDSYLEVCCSPTAITENLTKSSTKNKREETTHSLVTDAIKTDDCVCVAYYRCNRTGADADRITDNDAKCQSYLDLCCSPSDILKD